MLDQQIKEIIERDFSKTEHSPDEEPSQKPTYEQKVLGFNVILHKAVTLQMTLLGSENDRVTYSKQLQQKQKLIQK